MPVFIHHSTLIINKKSVEALTPGGCATFRKEFIDGRDPIDFTEDDELFSMGGYNSDEHEIGDMERMGLLFDDETQSSPHFTIVERYGSMLWHVDWLQHNASFAWHIDCSPELKQRAIDFDSLTMAYLASVFESGGNPFTTMRSW